jgi:hypothetical protein
VTIVLASLVGLIFGLLGSAKVLAVPRMRALAREAGFTTSAYRRIGGLELAGATGVGLGPAVPLFGLLAAGGLLCLLTGAVVVHVRKRAGAAEIVPAALCAVLVVSYAVALVGASG